MINKDGGNLVFILWEINSLKREIMNETEI